MGRLANGGGKVKHCYGYGQNLSYNIFLAMALIFLSQELFLQ